MKTTNPAARLAAIEDTVSRLQSLVSDAADRYDRTSSPADRAAIVTALQAAVQAEADAISDRAADFERAGITHE